MMKMIDRLIENVVQKYLAKRVDEWKKGFDQESKDAIASCWRAGWELQDRIKTEQFLDDVVSRINKKQLRRK